MQAFQNEQGGAIEADLCWGVALLQMEGLYFDVDLWVRKSVWNILQHNTTFSSVTSNTKPNEPKTFFHAFMAATPRHPLVRRYIELFYELFYDHYRGVLPHPLEPDADVGVFLLKQAWGDFLKIRRMNLRKLQSSFMNFCFDPSCNVTCRI